MNLSHLSDLSLYELATHSDSHLQPLQISPTTFKSLISIVIDLLIEQQTPTTIWLKLPRGEVWQAEVDRFCQSATAPYTLHCLQTYQESTSEIREPGDDRLEASQLASLAQHGSSSWDETEISSQKRPGTMMVDDLSEQNASSVSESKLLTLPLSPESQLKREYFLLFASPGFYGLVLAHRPRSIRSRAEGNTQELSSTTTRTNHKPNQMIEENLEQKHPLLGLCSFEEPVIQQVLEGVNRAICCGQSVNQSSAEIEALMVSWEDLQAQGMVTTLNPLLMGQLLTKQIQRQEEIWRSGAVYRRQADQATALRHDNEDLLAALRLKDEFVKTMGQELRTPLTSMKTALSLLNSPNIKPQQRQRYMDMLSKECDRQSSLITSVLDLIQIESAVEQMPMEALRLADIVPGVVSTYQPLAQEKGLMLGYMVPEELPPVSCVNQWLKQIVISLLHNSIKFTPSGGQVWVRARRQGDSIQIEIRDTGIGIAQAEIPKIFDRFYRIRGNGEDTGGAGLGLSIVQQLLLRCGGSISVRSKPGEGSVFSVLLPIYDQDDQSEIKEQVSSTVQKR